ncbi:MAG TPA: hypothetical protein VGF92_21025 [Stellaceae bacterium]|jgi:hypothetical protein
MAFRSDDQDYRWPSDRLRQRDEQTRGDTADSLSLHDTLRELAITIVGFVGVILLIVTAVKFLHG